MRISVIIPTYNSIKWIQSCIDSVFAQTYQHFDIIILDSGSTDETLVYIKSLNDERIKIYTTEKRLSIEENWARIKDIPRAEFMTILGHDDIFYPGFLEEINNLIIAYPDAGVYLTHFDLIDKSGNIIRKCQPMEKIIDAELFLKKQLLTSLDITATGFVMRSKTYDEIGGIPSYPNLLYGDIELWFRAIEKGYLVIAPKTYFAFRFHPDNTSKSTTGRLKAFSMLIDFLKRIEDERIEYKKIIRKFGSSFLLNFAIGSCHKLLYLSKKNRNGLTINKLLDESEKHAKKLIPGIPFNPEKSRGIKLARIADSTVATRGLFRFLTLFKRRVF